MTREADTARRRARVHARTRSVVWALALAAAAVAGVARGRALLALCDITMADGEVVECVVPISRELTFDDAATDGFYVGRTGPDGRQVSLPYLFSADFEWLEPHTGRGQSATTGPFGDALGAGSYSAHYLRDITGRLGPPRVEREDVEDHGGQKILRREMVYRSRHAMLDYVPIYTDVLTALQGACFPSTLGPVPQETRVPLARVQRFTLVRFPSAGRLQQVRDGLSAWEASVTADPIEEDVPSWYHHVVTRPPGIAWEFRTWRMTP